MLTNQHQVKSNVSKAPTLKDIAENVGVSVITVSNVLRPKVLGERICYSKEVERRVIEAASKLGYVPNRSARAMRTQRTGVVGFAASNSSENRGDMENYVVYPFLVGLSHELTASQRHVVMIELYELEQQKRGELSVALRERYFDALVVQYGLSPQALKLLEEYRIPIIYWDSGVFEKENCLYRDEREVGRIAATRLLEAGHRRIAFIATESWDRFEEGSSIHYSLLQRYNGVSEALAGCGVKIDILRGCDPKEWARQISKNKISGVVCYDKTGYIPLLRAALMLGLRVPGDLSIVSCDVEQSVHDYGDRPSGILYNRYEAGKTAGKMMISRLDAPERPVSSVVLPIEFLSGDTVSEPGNRPGKSGK